LLLFANIYNLISFNLIKDVSTIPLNWGQFFINCPNFISNFEFIITFVASTTKFMVTPYPFGVSSILFQFATIFRVVILFWLFRQVDFHFSRLLSTPYDVFASIKSTFPINLSFAFIIYLLLIISTSPSNVSIMVGMLAPASLAYQLVNSTDPL